MKKVKTLGLKKILKNLHYAILSEKFKYLDEDILLDMEENKKFSRRLFLENTTKTIGTIVGGTTIFSTLSCESTPNKANNQNQKIETNLTEKVKVAIIGAGIAGLSAAYTLKKKGIIAQVYEGDTRVGGRILTKKNVFGEGLITEFGGEFIDSNHSDMINLAKEFNLELLDTQEDNKIIKDAYFFDNKHYSEKEVIVEFRKIVKKLLQDKKKCGEDYNTPYAKNLDNVSLEEYTRSLNCSKWLQDWIMCAYVAEYGLDAGQQSALNFVDMIDTDVTEGVKIYGDSDERYKIKGGNQQIVDALAKILNNQIHVNQKLTALKSQNNKIDLFFNDTKQLTCDFVIITVPFTILRSINMKIDNVKEDKLRCINHLGYGKNNKLLLGFNSRIWRENITPRSGYLFHNDIHNGWDNSHMQANNQGKGGYTILLGGSASLKLAEAAQMSDIKDSVSNALAKEYVKKIDSVFNNALNQFNGVHKAALWSNNFFAIGSYACYEPGQWTSISGKEFEPIGNIYFAGEHCSNDFQGYMNGGAETGRRAAEKISSLIK